MSSKSHEKNALTKGTRARKNEIDVNNHMKVSLWRDMVLSSEFTKVILTKAMTGRDAWYDEEVGDIVLGDKLEPETLLQYEKMIMQKVIASPKEIVESSSDGGAGSLKAILAEIRDETKKNNESSDRPVIDVDLDGGDVDF
jgi:hypothetical protein